MKVLLLSMILTLTSCSSYQEFQNIANEYEMPSQVFKADFTQTWQSVLQVMQKYDLALQDQASGVIKTRWIDNTSQLNFEDSFGGKNSVKAAKFKLVINVVKGFRGRREVTQVTLFKRQMVEKDFLQGWKVIRTDGILEKTILYRVERNILIDNKLKRIEGKMNKASL
ncbi:MAG: hypothetical protein ACO20H_13085 [Bacteriovoracaceae bacterium]